MSYVTNEQLLSTNLSIDSKEMNSDIDNIIKNKLIGQLEGVCYDNGYIVKGSVKIINRKMGEIKSVNNKSTIKYLINYKANVISPSQGDVIEAYINNINKMGVVSYIKVDGEDSSSVDIDDSPLIIMIPNEYFGDSILNIGDLNIGQVIKVVVVGSRVKFKSDKIQVIAKPEN
jgi:DNA-directed RNA polymerase subunit E'/Rpb7